MSGLQSRRTSVDTSLPAFTKPLQHPVTARRIRLILSQILSFKISTEKIDDLSPITEDEEVDPGHHHDYGPKKRALHQHMAADVYLIRRATQESSVHHTRNIVVIDPHLKLRKLGSNSSST